MSIMQEYNQIKKIVGLKEWNNMEEFLKVSPGILLSDLLYDKEVYSHYSSWKDSNL